MYGDLQLEPSSTVDRAVDEIRRALFAGQLAPGTPLREVALSEAMGVGRSTIREALTVLVSEGLTVRQPHRGVAVKELSADDVHDVIVARLALESAGVRRWPAASDTQRTAVRAAFEHYATVASSTADPVAVSEAHLWVHRSLVGLTGSERLVATAETLGAEIRLGLAHLDRTRANLVEQVDDHRGLVELLESGDVEGTLQRLTAHLAAAEHSLLHATGHEAEAVG